MTDFTIEGRNRQLVPGTLNTDEDTVTFLGTPGNDTLIGGAGEYFTLFLATRGSDLYGVANGFIGYADYSSALSRIVVDLTQDGGTRTFTGEDGEQRTVDILGMALRDGYGGIDSFVAYPDADFSSIIGIYGSAFNDVLIGGNLCDLYGGDGNDKMIGGFLTGEAGNDHLIAVSAGDSSTYLDGGDGHDFFFGSDDADYKFLGGSGDDRIFARGGDDRFVVGEAGNDYVDGGTGDDFTDGGIGGDVLVSGAGNDTINPDVEFFQSDPNQARDGDRDVIRVTRQDLGDFTDVVVARAFEAGRDQIRFLEAAYREDYRVIHEAQTIDEASGLPYQGPDLIDSADLRNTVLQIDQDGDGFGNGTRDTDDYFLVVLDADLSLRHGYLLT